jgi:pimeloyl-ACP methyl ester carboxylesterase
VSSRFFLFHSTTQHSIHPPRLPSQADYALLIGQLKIEHNAAAAPVVAFGGSYGGMLAAWIRIKYPNVVDGAIAASAPIWGLPLTSNAVDPHNTKVSGSSAVLVRCLVFGLHFALERMEGNVLDPTYSSMLLGCEGSLRVSQ